MLDRALSLRCRSASLAMTRWPIRPYAHAGAAEWTANRDARQDASSRRYITRAPWRRVVWNPIMPAEPQPDSAVGPNSTSSLRLVPSHS
jgi:hypothetical protein